jgi:hypothetical protein
MNFKLKTLLSTLALISSVGCIPKGNLVSSKISDISPITKEDGGSNGGSNSGGSNSGGSNSGGSNSGGSNSGGSNNGGSNSGGSNSGGSNSGGSNSGGSNSGGSNSGGSTGGSGAGTAAGCTATPNVICKGGYESDSSPKSLKVKVVYGNPVGTRLTTNPVEHAANFVKLVNSNYEYQGHRYMNLQLDTNKVIEVDQEDDATMVSKYVEDGYVTLILVASIPGPTAGYVAGGNVCAELQKKQGWTVFEFPLVAQGVVEHEINHLFCFPHTSSQNGQYSSFFIPGYNLMKNILQDKGVFKKPFSPDFKNYVDQQNRSNASVTHDNMLYYTGNLMYYSVLPQKPKLFTDHGEGYPYSYSHLMDYYYWNFIKPHAK